MYLHDYSSVALRKYIINYIENVIAILQSQDCFLVCIDDDGWVRYDHRLLDGESERKHSPYIKFINIDEILVHQYIDVNLLNENNIMSGCTMELHADGEMFFQRKIIKKLKDVSAFFDQDLINNITDYYNPLIEGAIR